MNVVIAGRDEKTRICSLVFVVGRSRIQFSGIALKLQSFFFGVCVCVDNFLQPFAALLIHSSRHVSTSLLF